MSLQLNGNKTAHSASSCFSSTLSVLEQSREDDDENEKLSRKENEKSVNKKLIPSFLVWFRVARHHLQLMFQKSSIDENREQWLGLKR